MMRRAILFGAGLLWYGFTLGFGFLLMQYLAEGAGFQFFASFAFSGSVLLGLAHFIGLCAAIVICFSIGSGLCSRAIIGTERK